MNPAKWESYATEMALRRYGVIAPLVSRKLSRDEYRHELEKIVAAVHTFPDGDRMVSKRTVSRWCNWYRHGHLNEATGEHDSPPGADALRPTRRGDRGDTRVIEPSIIERAARLRAEQPSRSTTTLIGIVREEAEARGETLPEIKPATLAYHLRTRGATREQLKGEGRAYPRYEHAYRNAVWQGDWSSGIWLPDPLNPKKTRLCHLHAFICDHTRYIPHAEFYFRQNLPCLEDCFRKAVLKSGIPECTYWDNGAVYQARQVRLLAARMGIQVIFATPYAPEGKGKVERFFRTVKDAFYPEARSAGLETLEELNQFFWAWLDKEYHDRVHGSLNGKTPRERWDAGASGVRLPEPSSLVDLFLWEETRKVDKAGCVRLSGNVYPVAEHLVRQEVLVRFDPFDLSQVRIYSSAGTFLEAAKPQKLQSHTFRKALPRRTEKPAPLESSAGYRRQLSKGLRQKVDDTAARARRGGSCLTNPEFCAAVTEALAGRHLSASERRRVADFFRRNAPLDAETVGDALKAAIDEKGSTRHIRFYLDTIRERRIGGRRHG